MKFVSIPHRHAINIGPDGFIWEGWRSFNSSQARDKRFGCNDIGSIPCSFNSSQARDKPDYFFAFSYSLCIVSIPHRHAINKAGITISGFSQKCFNSSQARDKLSKKTRKQETNQQVSIPHRHAINLNLLIFLKDIYCCFNSSQARDKPKNQFTYKENEQVSIPHRHAINRQRTSNFTI